MNTFLQKISIACMCLFVHVQADESKLFTIHCVGIRNDSNVPYVCNSYQNVWLENGTHVVEKHSIEKFNVPVDIFNDDHYIKIWVHDEPSSLLTEWIKYVYYRQNVSEKSSDEIIIQLNAEKKNIDITAYRSTQYTDTPKKYIATIQKHFCDREMFFWIVIQLDGTIRLEKDITYEDSLDCAKDSRTSEPVKTADCIKYASEERKLVLKARFFDGVKIASIVAAYKTIYMMTKSKGVSFAAAMVQTFLVARWKPKASYVSTAIYAPFGAAAFYTYVIVLYYAVKNMQKNH